MRHTAQRRIIQNDISQPRMGSGAYTLKHAHEKEKRDVTGYQGQGEQHGQGDASLHPGFGFCEKSEIQWNTAFLQKYVRAQVAQ